MLTPGLKITDAEVTAQRPQVVFDNQLYQLFSLHHLWLLAETLLPGADLHKDRGYVIVIQPISNMIP